MTKKGRIYFSENRSTPFISTSIHQPKLDKPDNNMNLIYCDHGIIVEWLKGAPIATQAINKLLNANLQPVYSPAHIEELAVPVERSGLSEKVIMEELKKLSLLTGNIEILPNSRRGLRKIHSEGDFGAFICIENPKKCYARVTSNYKALNDLAESGQKLFSSTANREAGDRVPGTVNLRDPQDILQSSLVKQQILSQYHSIFHMGRQYAQTVTGILKQSPFIDVPDPAKCIDSLKGNHDATQAMVESVIKCLIRERYYPDPIKKHRSEMHDISHAVYASYFDLYVIEDEKSRKKCIATYEFLGIKTKVLSPSEIIKKF
jgi:hypothetical protein